MLPPSPDSRALRIRLMEKLGALKAYFEATSVSVGMKSPYWSAFDALRRNQPLAEAFVADLQQLLDFLETEMVPALSQPASARPSVQVPLVPQQSGPLNDQETRVLDTSAQPMLRGARSVPSAPARTRNEPSDSGAIPIEDSSELIPMPQAV